MRKAVNVIRRRRLHRNKTMKQTSDPKFLRLQAKMSRERLPQLCRESGLSLSAVLRVASHSVHDEDVLEKPSTKSNPALELAKQIHRLERKAADPDYPVSAKQRYRENEENVHQFWRQLRSNNGTTAGQESS
jgi:hypothetical protein